MCWIIIIALVVAVNFLLPKLFTRKDNQVIFIAGQIGAGKSAYSVKLARKALKNGRKVFSTDYIEGCYYFNVEWLESRKCPENSLLIIDETALKFNSRNFAKMQTSIIAYFKKCRHYKNDVVLISQTFGDTDKQIREISTKVLFMRKFGYFTIPVKVKGDITIGDDGQPTIKYKIGRFGKPFVPALQGKYYNSWEDASNRLFCPVVTWAEYLKQGECMSDD